MRRSRAQCHRAKSMARVSATAAMVRLRRRNRRNGVILGECEVVFIGTAAVFAQNSERESNGSKSFDDAGGSVLCCLLYLSGIDGLG